MKRNNLVKRKKVPADSVAYRQSIVGVKQDLQLLEQCQVLWQNLSYFREKRARALRFVYGDQWGDTITVDGKTTTQREYVTSQGNVALQTNQIKTMVNTISGVYTKEQNEPVCHARDREEQRYGEVMTTTLQANWTINKMKLMMINAIEEATIGGLCVSHENYGRKDGIEDAWTENVNPNYIFFDSGMKDPRFWDMSLVGEIHDIPFTTFCSKFCQSEADLKKAEEWYAVQSHPFNVAPTQDVNKKNKENTMSFYNSSDPSMCRVFEVWSKETKPRYQVHDWNTGELYIVNASDTEMLRTIEEQNKERIQLAQEAGWDVDEAPLIEKEYFIDEYWYCRFLTPEGYIVWEGESPYGNIHPYSICAVPFTDGKIVSPISDAIDQNIAINRLLTLHDWVTRSNAKGVTMVPNQVVPDTMSKEDFAKRWTSINGMIFYEAKPGVPEPKQFYGHTSNLNTSEMVKMMYDLMQSSVAVSGALQGKQPYSGTSASLYAQQTMNSSNPIATLFARFESYVNDLATKKLRIIQLFYTPERYEKIAGQIDGIMDAGLQLDKTGNLEYDLSIKQSTETPVHRMLANDLLIQFWEKGAISLQDVLKNGEFPFADKLLQSLEANQQEVQQGAAPDMGQPVPGQVPDANYERAKDMMLHQ